MEGPALLLILVFLAKLPDGLSMINGKGPLHSKIVDGRHCFDGKTYPVNLKQDWDGYSCYDLQGNQYKAGQLLLSCCGCLKMTCLATNTSIEPDGRWKSFWNLTLDDSCCQDCHGNVFPAGSLMSSHMMQDNCSTTVTKLCVFLSNGNKSKAVTSVSFDYKSCCTDMTGLHPISSVVLEPETCSSRQCLHPDGNLYASWTSTTLYRGCDCCIHNGEFFPNGGNVSLGKDVYATCCNGEILVPVATGNATTTKTTITATTSTTTTTTTTTKRTTTTTKRTSTTFRPRYCHESNLKNCPFDSYKKLSPFINFLFENVFTAFDTEVANNDTDVFTFIRDGTYNPGSQDSVKIQEFIFKLLVTRFVHSGKVFNYAYYTNVWNTGHCNNNICKLGGFWTRIHNGKSKPDLLAGHGYGEGRGFWVPNSAKHHKTYCKNFPKIKTSANSLVILMRNSPARHDSWFPTPGTDPKHFVSDQRVMALGLDAAIQEDLDIAASEPSMALFFPTRTQDQLKKDLELLGLLWSCVNKDCCPSNTRTNRVQTNEEKEEIIYAQDPEEGKILSEASEGEVIYAQDQDEENP